MTPQDTLKPTWPHVKFGDVVKLNTDRSADPLADGLERYVGLEHIEPEDLRIRRWGLVTEGTTFTNRFRPGQVLFGKRRAYQRKVAVADFEGVCSSDIYVFEPKDDRLLPELLPFLCQTEGFFEHAVGTSAGSLSPRTNWTQLANYEFGLPSLDEQRKLAELLVSIHESLDSLRELIESEDVLAEAYLNTVFSYDTDGTDSDPGVGFVRLGNVCSVQVGYPFQSSGYADIGDRLLRCSNVGVREVSWEEDITKYWPSERRHEVSEYLLGEGDIVVAMDRPFVGKGFKVARINSTDLPALLLQRVGRFKPSQNLHEGYLWSFLNSTSLQWQLQRQQQGTDLPHISKFDIENTYLPERSLPEQANIALQYLSIESVINDTQKRWKLLKTMLKHILTSNLDYAII